MTLYKTIKMKHSFISKILIYYEKQIFFLVFNKNNDSQFIIMCLLVPKDSRFLYKVSL